MADLYAQFGIDPAASGTAPPPAPKDDNSAAPEPTVAAPALAAPDVAPAPVPEVKSDVASPTPVETPDGSATPADKGPVDLYASNGITPPSVTERNQFALARIQPLGATSAVNGTLVATSETPHDDAAQMEQLAKARFTPAQIAEFKSNPITFGDAPKYLDWSDELPGGGVYRGYKMLQAAGIASKLQNGEDISDGEKTLLYGIIDKNIEMSLRGFSVGGGIRYYGSQMPAFMAEFAATGGVGKAAEAGTAKAVEALGMQAVENATLKSLTGVATKAVGASANVAARTAVMPSLYVSQYGERRLNDEVSITDKGDVLLKQSEESPAKSALMAFAYSSANVASELAGEGIRAGGQLLANTKVGQAVIATAKTPFIYAINQVPAAVREGLYKAYQAIKPNATMSKVFTAAGWNGMLNELGENRIQEVLNATIGYVGNDKQNGPATFDNYLDALTPSKDQLLTEAGIISIAGGVKAAGDISMNLMRVKGMPDADAHETTQNMTATEQDGFVSKHLQLPQSKLPDDLPSSPEATDLISRQPTVKQALADGAPVQGNFEGELMDGQLKAAEAQDPPTIDHTESSFNKFYRNWVNELDPIQSLPALARARGKQVPVGDDTKLLSTAHAGVMGSIRQNLQVATFRRDPVTGENTVTGKGLKPILDDFDNLMMGHEPSRDARQEDLAQYLVARRYTTDLAGRDDVEVTEKQKLDSIKSLSDLAAKYGDNFRFFETSAQEIYDFQKRILGNLVDSGVMSKESFDGIVEKNPHYIPFQRVLEEPDFSGAIAASGVFTKTNANRIVKGIKGSENDVKNVFHSMIKNTAQIIDMSSRNNVARSVTNLADVLPEYIQKVATPMAKVGEVTKEDGTQQAIFRPSQYQPKGTVAVRVNGKKQYFEVSKPILEAMEGMSHAQLNFLEKTFQSSAQLLRAGATLIPEFWVRNALRDQHDALLQSGVPYRPTDFAKGIWGVLGHTELYNEWERSGGSFNSYMELDDKGMDKAYRELLRPEGKLMHYLNPIHLAESISGGIEQSTRVGVFNAATQKGGQSALEGAFTSRDATLNFARRGRVGKGVNRYIPFFNAGIQGTDKLIRTFKDNPAAFTMYGLATITLPSVALTGYYLYGADDKTRQEYLEIPQWEKDMFFTFKHGDQWHRYPKPFSPGYIFGSMPQRMMEWMYNGNKPQGENAFRSLVLGLGGSLSPINDVSSILPPLVKAAIESVTNYNFFTGRNIYPEWMGRLDPEQRSNKYTSETAKFIGKEFGVSPAKVDNAMRDQLAGSADYVARAGDFILDSVKKWNGETVPEKPLTQSDTPLVRAFAVRNPSGYRSQSAQDFFDNLNQVQQRHATYQKLEGKEQDNYEKTHGRELDLYSDMNDSYKEMKSVQDDIDEIYDDPKMAGQRKAERISKLEDQITVIARDANHTYTRALKGASK